MKVKLQFLFMAMVFICCNSKEKKENASYSDSNQIYGNIQENLPDTSKYSVKLNSETKEVVLPFGSGFIEHIKLPIEWDNKDSIGLLTAEEKTFNKISKYYRDVNGNYTKSITGILKTESISSIELNEMADFNTSLLKSISNIKYQLPNMGPYQCFYSYNEAKEVPLIYIDSSGKKKEYDYENTPSYYSSTGNLILYNKISKTAKVINIYSEVLMPFQVEMRLFLINEKRQIMLFRYSNEEIYGSLAEEYLINIQVDGEIEVVTL